MLPQNITAAEVSAQISYHESELRKLKELVSQMEMERQERR